ncbi:MAG: hypothetical protein LC652_12360 [Halomonas sp.]|nr:hypothetical protein [Halomonas sp.]
MKTKRFLKKAAVLSVSLGLLASPLAFADMHDPAADENEASDSMTSQPADPAAMPADPAADPMADQGAPAEPGATDEPGFGSGTDPLPSGEDAAQPDEEHGWELPDDEESSVN